MDAARFDKRLNEVTAAFNAGFKSESSRKRALQVLGYAYEIITDAVDKAIRDHVWSQFPDYCPEMSKLFDEYRIPHALHEVREKHFEIAAKFSSEFGIVRELIELRNAIKNAPIEKVLRAPKTSPRMEAMKRTLIEELEARKANIAAAHASANFSIQNEHVPHVSIHGHWVWGHKGTKFVRHFWYLNGRVTAENTIAAVFQKLEDEGKIEPFVDEDGQTRVRVAK